MSTPSPKSRYLTRDQKDAYTSSWSVGTRIKIVLWATCRILLFRPSPKPCNAWRLFLLRMFGCRISGRPFIYPSAIVKMPWQLTLEDKACLGPASQVYNLGHVTLRQRSTLSQEAYLCGGTHDFSVTRLPLITAPIEIQEDAFLGARAFVMPGVIVGRGAIVGACAVVTRDVPAWSVAAGNPAAVIGRRTITDAPANAADGAPPFDSHITT